MTDLVVLTMNVSATHDGHRVSLTKGRVAYADDPFVQANPHLFKPLDVTYVAARRGSGVVEQATAAPGEKRDLPDPKAVRAWAADNGIDVPARGKLPADVVDQYLTATNDG